MSITTVLALDRVPNRQTLLCVKNSVSLQASGTATSFWLAASVSSLPAPGVAPTTAAICDGTLTGALQFVAPLAGLRTYLQAVRFVGSNVGGEVDIADRLGHMGGLSGTVITAQTVNLDISVGTSNLANRIGSADYSEVVWMLEWYVTTGASVVTMAVAVTYNDGTTDTITVAPGTSNLAPGRMFPILPNAANKYIKSVQSVTLSGTTGTAGNFGVTAYRVLAVFDIAFLPSGGGSTERDWYGMCCRIHDSACLAPIALVSSAASGSITGALNLVQG